MLFDRTISIISTVLSVSLPLEFKIFIPSFGCVLEIWKLAETVGIQTKVVPSSAAFETAAGFMPPAAEFNEIDPYSLFNEQLISCFKNLEPADKMKYSK